MAKHLQREIERLKASIMELGTKVEETFHRAVASLENMDLEEAKVIIASDDQIDQLEIEIEEECLKILALHQPVAVDLRFLVAVLKINSDLERIGDLALNISQRVIYLKDMEPIVIPFDFPGMSARVEKMIRLALNALVNFDMELAYEVIRLDDEVDHIHATMYSQVTDKIQETPRFAKNLMHYLSVSRYLERIADHTTNIAEDIIYMIEGDIVRHKV